jgi:hypothetical protein
MHKFKVGQLVRVLPSRNPNGPSPGMYEVVRTLPSETTPQYRIKGLHEEFQRVVDEALLTDGLEERQPSASYGATVNRRERLPV